MTKTMTQRIATLKQLIDEHANAPTAGFGSDARLAELARGGEIRRQSVALWAAADADPSALTDDEVAWIEGNVTP